MHRTLRRGVFTRKAEGKLYSITSNGEIAEQILNEEAGFALLGSDKFDELTETASLGYEAVGKLPCQFVFAAPEGVILPPSPTVATSYPRAFQRFVETSDNAARLGRIMSGKVESAPARGLSDAIFDICESGTSLTANGLSVRYWGEQLQLGALWLKEGNGQPPLDLQGYCASLQTIAERAKDVREGKIPSTYTEKLLASQNERVKKIASEAGELVQEMARPDFDQGRFVGEASDVVYAVCVACEAQGVPFGLVLNELANRNRK